MWGDGEPNDRETGCADAFYAVDQERRMLWEWLGRNGMDGAGGWVPIRMGLDDVNAYYTGSSVDIGHSHDRLRLVSSLDVVAHEFGHGIDHNTPGSLSDDTTREFIADTFGAATEWYADNATDRPDYLIGETVDFHGTGAIRNMADPGSMGHPGCYDKAELAKAEAHSAAGVGDHWFYLLAEGSAPVNGQPASPTCNRGEVTGVGIQKALQVLYNAMLMKNSGSDYPAYRTWTLTAAKYLDPSCALYTTVKAAWEAVSVPAETGRQPEPTCALTVVGPGARTAAIGSSITPFTLKARGGASPYTWSATGLPAGVGIDVETGTVSGSPAGPAGTHTVTVTAASGNLTGSTTFTFTVTGASCSGQLLGNAGFETGRAAPWSAPPGVVDGSAGQPAHSGAWKAWLGGYGERRADELSQTVTIPAGCKATLSFWLHVDSDETGSKEYDVLTLRIGNVKVKKTYSNLDRAAGYQKHTFDVSAFAGRTVALKFTSSEDADTQTSFVIDDVALTVG
jgi:hypothetical protein